MMEPNVSNTRMEEKAARLKQIIVDHQRDDAGAVVTEMLEPTQLTLMPEYVDDRGDREVRREIFRILRDSAHSMGVSDGVLNAAYGRCPDLVAVAQALASDDPEAELDTLAPQVFRPFIPSVAKRYFGPEDAWKRTNGGSWIIEPKLDGWECQIHVGGGQVRLFGRKGTEFTDIAPTVVEETRRLLGHSQLIMEAELLAVDGAGQILPRARMKHSPAHKAVVFDLLYLNGDCTRLPCERRASLIKTILHENADHVSATEQMLTDQFAVFNQCFELWHQNYHEGMIGKRPDAVYEANQRTSNRIKIKVKDTVDALIIGYAEAPRVYLAALWDKDLFEFVPFAWVPAKSFDELAPYVGGLLDPMLPPLRIGKRTTVARLGPGLVVEVLGEHRQSTTNFRCGMSQTGKGWTLFSPTAGDIRSDKSSDDVTTVDEFLDLPVMSGN